MQKSDYVREKEKFEEKNRGIWQRHTDGELMTRKLQTPMSVQANSVSARRVQSLVILAQLIGTAKKVKIVNRRQKEKVRKGRLLRSQDIKFTRAENAGKR